jgi:ligand-binding SRPBCC domain-containing protein
VIRSTLGKVVPWMSMGGEVSLHMDAPPEQVWALVSDVTRIGEFSPETFEARWRRGSTGPEVGARFKGHVKRNGVGPTYWSACRVTACVPNELFEFVVEVEGPVDAQVNRWGYRLEPDGDCTRVTEYYQLGSSLPMQAYWLVLGPFRGRTNSRGMRSTLERMKAVVER